MPRYVVERTFPGGLALATTEAGAQVVRGVVEVNAQLGVTWVRSYVSDDRERVFDIYDGPGPEAVRTAAERNHLPIDELTPVSVLDPYFYRTGS